MDEGLVLDGPDKVIDRVAEAQILQAVPSCRQQYFIISPSFQGQNNFASLSICLDNCQRLFKEHFARIAWHNAA